MSAAPGAPTRRSTHPPPPPWPGGDGEALQRADAGPGCRAHRPPSRHLPLHSATWPLSPQRRELSSRQLRRQLRLGRGRAPLIPASQPLGCRVGLGGAQALMALRVPTASSHENRSGTRGVEKSSRREPASHMAGLSFLLPLPLPGRSVGPIYAQIGHIFTHSSNYLKGA